MHSKLLILLFVSFILLSLSGCDSLDRPQNNTNNSKTLIKGKTMGTTYHVAIVHPKTVDVNSDSLKVDIDNLLKALNQQISTYIPSSKISQFNQAKNTLWTKVDDDFFVITEAANEVSKKSEGAFDISVSPLIELWGFGTENRDKVPNITQIKEAMESIGYQKLQLNKTQSSIKKTENNLRIDLSAIAKGFAVDKVSEQLIAKGFPNHLVEIGGELKASGLSQTDKKWRIAVEQPDMNSTVAQRGLAITNLAVATSGDYRNYFIEKGVRLSHIIDPKTGYPIKHNLASVTVLHESTMLADAYATALLVMGDKKGKIFAQENNLDVLMIIRNEDKFIFWNSSNIFR